MAVQKQCQTSELGQCSHRKSSAGDIAGIFREMGVRLKRSSFELIGESCAGHFPAMGFAVNEDFDGLDLVIFHDDPGGNIFRFPDLRKNVGGLSITGPVADGLGFIVLPSVGINSKS